MSSPTGPPAVADQQAVQLAQTFVSLADTLVDDYDVVDLLDRLTQTSVELLGASAAGLLLLDQRAGLQVVASSGEQVRLLELFQLQNEEGPCLDCISTGAAVVVPDLEAAVERWPRFATEATATGYTSVCAVPLRLRAQVIGGLNLFQAGGPAFTGDQQRIAQALADVATIGILQQRSMHRAGVLAEQLQVALDSRIVVEQAKGVLAEQGQVPMETAYATLRRHARDHNLGLSEVAESIVRGQLAYAGMRPVGG